MNIPYSYLTLEKSVTLELVNFKARHHTNAIIMTAAWFTDPVTTERWMWSYGTNTWTSCQ